MPNIPSCLVPYAEVCNIYANEPMSQHTTLRMGGAAAWFLLPQEMAAVPAILGALHGAGIPVTVVGRGSNLLVRDGGIAGAVLCMNDLAVVTVSGNTLTAQAGASLHAVAQAAAQHDLGDLAFLDGIPGTVGGALTMNAGAYGGEIGDFSPQTTVYHQGRIHTLDAAAQQLAYRSSWFQAHPDAVILSTTLTLNACDGAQSRQKMKDLAQQRRDKQPLNFPSAGSTFKRPAGHFAAKLIEDAGCKGYTVGGVQVSEKHAGFVVSHNQGTAGDMLQLIADVQQIVQQKYGVSLHPEVRILGEDL